MIHSKRKGNNYSKNIASSVLGFNDSSAWSVVGTGSASLEDTLYFEGSSSLNIENTSVKDDITATNVTQSTLIDIDGIYDISCYMLKKEALMVLTGEIEVFKNTVSLAVLPFSLGSTDVDYDKTNEWTPFFSNSNYSLAKGDVLTFTFKIDGIPASILTSLDLFIDGFMVYNKDRGQLEAPLFVPIEKTITQFNTAIITADTTAKKNDWLGVDATASAINIILPDATLNKDAQIVVKKTDSTANVVVLVGTTDGQLKRRLTTQYEVISLISDGVNWLISN